MTTQPRYLDPKVKLVWFLPTAILLVILWLVVTVGVFVMQPPGQEFGFDKPVFSLLFLLFLLVFVSGPIYAYHHVEYRSFTYELAATEIVIRSGVLTRHTTVIPYNRIQNVNTMRTVLERLLGLASLEIETAGTNVSASEGILPGVRDKDKLVHEILSHVEHSKMVEDGSGAAPAMAGALQSERQLLADILKELVSLNQHLRKNGKSPEERPPGHLHGLPPSPPNWRPKHD